MPTGKCAALPYTAFRNVRDKIKITTRPPDDHPLSCGQPSLLERVFRANFELLYSNSVEERSQPSPKPWPFRPRGQRSELAALRGDRNSGFIDGCKNNVLIIKNRHPDARKASARSHQRASRGPQARRFCAFGVGVGRRDLVFISKIGLYLCSSQ
jgi:hypothetical protein